LTFPKLLVEAAMSIKTILVHCDASKMLAQRLGVATALAESSGARLVGLHVRPPFQPPVVFDSGFTVAMNDFYRTYEETSKGDRAAASATFADAVKGLKLSGEWRQIDGPIDGQFAEQARYADLAVVGQFDPDAALATPPDLPQFTALNSGRPVMVIPYVGVQKPPGQNVLLCWNESRECSRAAGDALPILKNASQVTILIAEHLPTAANDSRKAGDRIERWLEQHGIKARTTIESGDGAEIGGLILSRAADLGVDLIVMGIYGHSRAREFVLGGASRTILSSMTVPVFMAH
jgi:nucleotide-binding universal stress UspA family protein